MNACIAIYIYFNWAFSSSSALDFFLVWCIEYYWLYFTVYSRKLCWNAHFCIEKCLHFIWDSIIVSKLIEPNGIHKICGLIFFPLGIIVIIVWFVHLALFYASSVDELFSPNKSVCCCSQYEYETIWLTKQQKTILRLHIFSKSRCV